MDETFVRIACRWVYLFRAVDGRGDTVDFYLSETADRQAAKTFLQKALSNPDNRTPRLLCGPLSDLPASDSRFASRRAFTAEVSTKDQTIRQQSG
jgi:hypothetical protein